MNLPYLLRLFCLSFSFFFLLNAAAGAVLRFFAEPAGNLAATRRSAAAANFIFGLRLLPAAIGILFVFLLCVPSYLRLEPGANPERVGPACIIFGLLGLTTWCLSAVRAMRAVVTSIRHHSRLARDAHRLHVGEHCCDLQVIDDDKPLLALSGLVRPRLLISRSLLRSLTPDELAAALSHEGAHRASRDNLKRLLLVLAPDVFPFANALHTLDQHWRKFTEWAADDQAVAGDSSRALCLASALVRVARLGASAPLPYLSTSLLASDRDLRARVDRLLHRAQVPSPSFFKARPRLGLIAFGSAIGLSALLLAPSTFHFIHELQELLLR